MLFQCLQHWRFAGVSPEARRVVTCFPERGILRLRLLSAQVLFICLTALLSSASGRHTAADFGYLVETSPTFNANCYVARVSKNLSITRRVSQDNNAQLLSPTGQTRRRSFAFPLNPSICYGLVHSPLLPRLLLLLSLHHRDILSPGLKPTAAYTRGASISATLPQTACCICSTGSYTPEAIAVFQPSGSLRVSMLEDSPGSV